MRKNLHELVKSAFTSRKSLGVLVIQRQKACSQFKLGTILSSLPADTMEDTNQKENGETFDRSKRVLDPVVGITAKK